jgi:putative ABC transport system substrate-binding protein
MRRIGMLMASAADDAESQLRMAGFLQGLSELGWTVGRNVRIDYRWGASNNDRDQLRRYAAEIAALMPDVAVTNTGSIAGALQSANRSLPIVAVGFLDPVAANLVDSLARPGSTITGFSGVGHGVSGKLLELLKQITPGITRVAVLRDPTSTGGAGQYGAIQAVAPSFGVELRPIDVRDAAAIDRGITAFAHDPNSGLVVATSALAQNHRAMIIGLAARYRLPAVYGGREFAHSGGLISYGPESLSQWRAAAGYVDRILKGEKPADLPVQAPVKYETVLNMKTAKALGLKVPDLVLVLADEVIE